LLLKGVVRRGFFSEKKKRVKKVAAVANTGWGAIGAQTMGLNSMAKREE